MDVTGKGALVTGGASGIGAAAVRRLAAAEARVAVADRDADAARALAGEVGGIALPGDVADPERMPAHVAAAEDAFGRLDVVLLNAVADPRPSGGGELASASGSTMSSPPVSHQARMKAVGNNPA
jgi:NAD(P)-dependent dehydrogenase (short-subunit alcohol dehydrogenase family)